VISLTWAEPDYQAVYYDCTNEKRGERGSLPHSPHQQGGGYSSVSSTLTAVRDRRSTSRSAAPKSVARLPPASIS
jgi:hypothetical protein